jgi:16S rRNA (cytidine1402-2'-O)-methyltransferase
MLFIVGVPIGQPDDVTLRALAALRKVDIVASENPQATQALLRHHGIHTTVTSYGPARIREKAAILIDRLRRGMTIALVSDCGSPVVSDPGSLLITQAHAQGIRVRSVPGPSAVTAAVAAAGLPDELWIFGGQLPESKVAMARRITAVLRDSRPSVLFCAANVLASAMTLFALRAPGRQVTLVCDLTMPGEQVICGTTRHVAQTIQKQPIGEKITLIVAGTKSQRTNRPHTKKRPIA